MGKEWGRMSKATEWMSVWDSDGSLPSIPALAVESRVASEKRRECIHQQTRFINEAAKSMRLYRKARARLTIQARDLLRGGLEIDGKTYVFEKATAAEVKALVDRETVNLRHDAEIADSMRWANKEAIEAHASDISLLQTLMRLVQSELEFVRGGGEGYGA